MTIIQAHLLTRRISVLRKESSLNNYREKIETWLPIATVHAQRLAPRVTDFLSGANTGTESNVVFRVRYGLDVTTVDEVLDEDGAEFEVLEILEMGRKEGLELRCRGRQ